MLSYFLETPFQINLSFAGLIEKLEETASDPLNQGYQRAVDLLKETTSFPGLRDGIKDIDQIKQHDVLIGKLLSDLFPASLSLNEIKAVSLPFINILINPTQRFKNILLDAGTEFDINILDFNDHQLYVSSCCIILNEFYGTHLDFSRPLFYDIPTANGVNKYYRILYNADFLDILPTEKSVKLSPEDIDQLLNNYDDLALWKEKFPKGSWILNGFAIMTLYDATIENAVSILKEKLLKSNATGFRKSMESIFRSIYKIPDIQIGFTVYNQHSDSFNLVDYAEPMPSFLLSDEVNKKDDLFCSRSKQNIIENKDFFVVSDADDFYRREPENHLIKHMLDQDIHSFVLAPVVKNGVLIGVLEVVSTRAKELNSVNAHKLDMVMPLLVDTIDRLINEFRNQVQAIIQKNYTSIHSSVYWKFSDEAQKLIRARRRGEEYVLKEIILDDVYPLYGQIDIKGSSETRNNFTKLDLENQFQFLSNVVLKVKNYLPESTFTELTEQISKSTELLDTSFYASTEQHIKDFLANKVHPQFKLIYDKDALPIINAYFVENDKEYGSFFAQRRKYETSISLINNKLALYFDRSESAAQAIYPHYYERFKTDGVEHNLYIGSSISPNHHFDFRKVQELRLWQLRILCEMETAHHNLKPDLPYPFDVTTLILAYHSTISLRFRMDEKRFDVDGTYNARYEVVKKRIDKAFIKGTGQRITEPGKITIVYVGKDEEFEYRQFIAVLQKEKLLDEVIENFQVEDLQGVIGLQALRVQILH